jgi:hypothetical protein
LQKTKADDSKAFWFITNDIELTPKEVAQAYRRR